MELKANKRRFLKSGTHHRKALCGTNMNSENSSTHERRSKLAMKAEERKMVCFMRDESLKEMETLAAIC